MIVLNTEATYNLMEKSKIKCKGCGKMSEVKSNGRYSRKYCDKCSADNKKYYDNLHLVKIGDCEECD